MLLILLQQNPIVVEVLRQPEATPGITWTDVILGAVGVSGILMLLATLVGLLVGGVIIFRKRRAESASPSADSGHVRLKI